MDEDINKMFEDNENEPKFRRKMVKKKLLSWLCNKAWIILPLICLWLMLFCPQVRIVWLVFALLGLGWAIGKVYNVFHDEDDIDFEKSSDSDSLPKFATIFHWVLVVAFLGLTFWAMWKCLSVMFDSEKDSPVFALLFALVVVATLAWLVVMISRGRNWKGFVVFYIIFDLMSAFSFNFIHFYNNVSQTQYVDRVMKVAGYYSDIQKGSIDKMYDIADNVVKFVNEKKSKTKELEEKKEKIGKDPTKTLKWYERDNNGRINKDVYNIVLNNRGDKEIEELDEKIKEIEREIDSVGIFDGFKDRLDTIYLRKNELDTLLAIQNPSMNEVDMVKNKIEEIQNGMEIYSGYRIFDSICIDVSNDTILYLNEVLDRKVEDRLGSVQKLFETLSYEFFMTEEEQQEADSLFLKPYFGHEQLCCFMMEEREYENRILILSIMLSMLIDIVPLALGVFVMLLRRKK